MAERDTPVEQDNVDRKQVGTPFPLPDIGASTGPAFPLTNYNLIHVAAEAEAREALLASVLVDEKGVAHARRGVQSIETLLVAVRIDDEQSASVLPLELVEGGSTLRLALSADKPTRFGFFVGHGSIVNDIAAVFRNGLYPGVPLVSESRTDSRDQEILIEVGGIKSTEADHLKWAEQVGLSGLGLESAKRRGFFGKSHRANPNSDVWQERPLALRPEELADMLPGYNPSQVRTNEFQVLFYETRPAVSHIDLSRFLVATRGDENTLSYGGGHLYLSSDSKEMAPSRGLGLGFGEPVTKRASTTGVDLVSLAGAFRIVAVPQ